MTISIPLVAILGAVVYVAYRYMGLRLSWYSFDREPLIRLLAQALPRADHIGPADPDGAEPGSSKSVLVRRSRAR